MPLWGRWHIHVQAPPGLAPPLSPPVELRPVRHLREAARGHRGGTSGVRGEPHAGSLGQDGGTVRCAQPRMAPRRALAEEQGEVLSGTLPLVALRGLCGPRHAAGSALRGGRVAPASAASGQPFYNGQAQIAKELINYFDLIMSLGCLHNLRLPDLTSALKEIERAGKYGFVMVESYRNEEELFNLQCWALTAETFLDTEEWCWLYQQLGYSGDYEFIYFE